MNFRNKGLGVIAQEKEQKKDVSDKQKLSNCRPSVLTITLLLINQNLNML
jgi:hypothetical protein